MFSYRKHGLSSTRLTVTRSTGYGSKTNPGFIRESSRDSNSLVTQLASLVPLIEGLI